MIPRTGQKWTLLRGKTKKRRVTVVVEGIYRRPPRNWDKPRDDKKRWWHEIYYRTDGTWAASGCRNITARGFLRIATPLKETPCSSAT
jgi:hypothetical protein